MAPGVSIKQLQESPVTPEGYIVHRVWMGSASDVTHLLHEVLVLITMLKPKLAGDILWETNLLVLRVTLKKYPYDIYWFCDCGARPKNHSHT